MDKEKKIEELEKRIIELEKRPQIMPVYPAVYQPPYMPNYGATPHYHGSNQLCWNNPCVWC